MTNVGVDKLNSLAKQQLIDKAIDDLGGVFKPVGHYHCIGRYGLHDIKFSLFYKSDDNYICTREEFEQRKKEREMEQNNWYNYELQQVTGKPPINSKVLYDDYKKGLIEVIILGYHPNVDSDAIWSQAIGSFGDDTNYSTDSLYHFRPLDWDKLSKRKEVASKALDIFAQGLSDRDGMLFLYDVGMLKLPEDK